MWHLHSRWGEELEQNCVGGRELIRVQSLQGNFVQIIAVPLNTRKGIEMCQTDKDGPCAAPSILQEGIAKVESRFWEGLVEGAGARESGTQSLLHYLRARKTI